MKWDFRKAVALTFLLTVALCGCLILILTIPRGESFEIENLTKAVTIAFSIHGEVHSPGIYEASEPIRISDAIEMAGGLTDDADPNVIDFLAVVKDGDELWISSLIKGGAEGVTIRNDSPSKINLNTATVEELMNLPGIGEKRAVDIVSLREEKGAFHEIEELMEIPGIGEKLLNQIYDFVTVNDKNEMFSLDDE